MNLNILYHRDCIEILKDENKIENESINLIYADPPYNLSGNALKWEGNKIGGNWYMVNEEWDKMEEGEYEKFTFDWIKECKRVLKPNGAIYISCSYHNIGECMMGLKKNGFKINNIITWYKTNAMPNMTKRVFTHSTEFVIWAVKGRKWIFNYEILKDINPEKTKDGKPKQMRDMWQMPLVQGKERIKGKDKRAAHPTQKPKEMLKRIILASSNEEDIVLDPFAGSGTTLVVADELNRNWIGIEKNTKYIELIKKRFINERQKEIKIK
jgi:site-specific DNA-methyltransferase (adenine-specific)/modification methylase